MRYGRLRYLASFLFSASVTLCHVAVGIAQEVDVDAPSSGVAVTNPDPAEPTPVPAEPLEFEPPVPIPAGVTIYTAIVTPGSEGSSVEFTGSVAGEGFDTMACNNAPDSIYCNTAGSSLFGLSGGDSTSLWADDIVTTGNAGCLIDRFVIRVTGDKKQDGSGVALGGYTVNYALYETCPGAEITPRMIPGTDGFMDVPVELAGDIVEIVHQIPSFVDAALPSIQFFLGIRFSRDKGGVVVGAQALKGFSADSVDLPGAACGARAVLGHSSFYAEIYARDECSETHVGYRNSNQGQAAISEGVEVRLADDIVLPEDCMLVAYEVSFKKAVIEIDLRTSLEGKDGPFIPGTGAQFANCFGCDVQVAHVDVDPPFHLSAGFPYWLATKSNSAAFGVVQTCRPPLIGESANLFMAFNSGTNAWEVENENNVNCFGNFDVTLYCQGAPPSGACCDMALTECLGGTEDGKPCSINLQCAGGTCESVCRDVPRVNCTGDALGVPLFWREGDKCGPICTAGGAVGASCTNDTDCSVCVGGSRDGVLCCDGGTCDQSGTCVDGTRDGLACCSDGSCPLGVCDGGFCDGGSSHGNPCTREVDCPDGSCIGGPFDHACGISACCTPFVFGNPLRACENLTENQCFAIEPVEDPRGFQVGRFCGVGGQRCPIAVCLLRDHACTIVDPQPGCFDRFCCTDVCEFDPWCCNVEWDELCVRWAHTFCDRIVTPNDECFGHVFNTPVQAQVLQIPDTVEGHSWDATPTVPSGGSGPGFCCHGQNPGGHGVGSIWYKFIATDTSARISTCSSFGLTIDGITYLSEDSLIAVYAITDTARGICADGSTCDVDQPNCADESECVFDEQFACDNLIPLACNDDDDSCIGGEQPKRSTLCVTDLVPGNPYYVQVAGKSNDRDPPDLPIVRGNGIWRVDISAPCSQAITPLHNDVCNQAEQHASGLNELLVIPFDISGERFGEAQATFDCPGPPVSCVFNTLTKEVWYDWTSEHTGSATIDACGMDNDTTPDTGMVVYEGCDCPVDDGRIVDCSWFEDTPCLAGSRAVIPVEEGQCYKIRFGGHLGGTPEGELKISVGDFCGNGLLDTNLCLGGANTNQECLDDTECPDGRCGEACDGGLGCLADCTCGDPMVTGYEKSFFPSTNCSAICGDGLVVVPEQCDGGLECGPFCTCNFTAQPTDPPSVDCVPNCGNGVLDFLEDCDSGMGCGANCTCEPGWEPAIPLDVDCEPPPCVPTSLGTPMCDGILSRISGSVIVLQYPSNPAACEATIQVRVLLAEGTYGADLSNEFTISNEGGTALKLTDKGATLNNETWYGITDDAGTKIDFLVVYGDVDGNGTTDALDMNMIWANRGAASDDSPYDMDGNGTIDALDVNNAWHFRNSTAPDKPPGHNCPE